jgi:hypothetical protein
MNDSLKTNILPTPRRRRGALKAIFVVAVMIASSMAAVGTASAANVCSITVNTPDLTPLHASYDGTATYNGPQSNILSFTVNWGDGTTEDIPVVDIPATGTDPFTWSASHDYATAGDYTVSIVMVHAQAQGQDTCAGAYTSTVTVPPPPTPEVCGNGVDDNGDGQIDEGCPPPPPPAEICGNGIDDNLNGQIDENCGGSTGGSTGGTHTSGGTKVLGKTKTKQAPLATTGAATTAAAWLGAMMLMLGLAMRFVRAPRSVSAVFAGQGSAAAEVQRYGLYLQARPTARRWIRR